MNKPPNAYILYRQKNYKHIKQTHPTLTFSELSKLLTKNWYMLDIDDKNKYYTKAYELQKKYTDYINNLQKST